MENLKNIQVGQKITVGRYNDFGFFTAIKMTVHEIRVESYAQYPETVAIIFKGPRQRKLRIVRFFPETKYVVWAGHVEPDTNIWASTKTDSSGVIVRRSESCFSEFYAQKAIDSLLQKPIFQKL